MAGSARTTLQATPWVTRPTLRLIEMNRIKWHTRPLLCDGGARDAAHPGMAALARGYQRAAAARSESRWTRGWSSRRRCRRIWSPWTRRCPRVAITDERKAQVVELRFFGA